jgi:DNA transformation protein
MAVSDDYLAYVLEQLAGLGQVSARRMFGGVGLYSEQLFFALIADDVLYLRADAANRAAFLAQGMAPFRPYATRPHLSMSYYATPAQVLEDAGELTAWARRSLEVAAAAAARAPRARSMRRRRP